MSLEDSHYELLLQLEYDRAMNPGNNLHKAIRLYDAAERQTSHHRRRYSHKFGLFVLLLRFKTFEIFREEGWTQYSEQKRRKEEKKDPFFIIFPLIMLIGDGSLETNKLWFAYTSAKCHQSVFKQESQLTC